MAGVVVIEVSAFVAAPYLGRCLAELGAEVIRVDRPGGGPDIGRWPISPTGESLYWLGLNAGKRSVCIDYRTPEGADLLAGLVRAIAPPTIVHNVPVPAAIGYSTLSSLEPGTIVLEITGDRLGAKAVDMTVQARTGVPGFTGPEMVDGPVNTPVPIWDLLTAMSGAFTLVGAILVRRETGEGTHIRLPLVDVACSVLATLGYLDDIAVNGVERPRIGNAIYGSFGTMLTTADAKHIFVAALTRRQWNALVSATGSRGEVEAIERATDSDFGQESDRFRQRDAIERVLQRWSSAHTLEEVEEAFGREQVMWSAYASMRDFVSFDPAARRDGHLFSAEGDPPRAMAAAWPAVSKLTSRDPLRSPRLGADTSALLQQHLDLSPTELAALRRQRIIG